WSCSPASSVSAPGHDCSRAWPRDLSRLCQGLRHGRRGAAFCATAWPHRSNRPRRQMTRAAFRGIAVMSRILASLAAASLATRGSAAPAMAQPAPAMPRGYERIQHVIVLYMENHSFDNLFGTFPGAEGLKQAGAKARQVDRDGKPYKTLPPVFDAYKKPPGPD